MQAARLSDYQQQQELGEFKEARDVDSIMFDEIESQPEMGRVPMSTIISHFPTSKGLCDAPPYDIPTHIESSVDRGVSNRYHPSLLVKLMVKIFSLFVY